MIIIIIVVVMSDRKANVDMTVNEKCVNVNTSRML